MHSNKNSFHSHSEDPEMGIANIHKADKVAVKCICPKCGSVHKMKFLWTGRGTPRKYCLLCKNFVSVVEAVVYHSVPSSV